MGNRGGNARARVAALGLVLLLVPAVAPAIDPGHIRVIGAGVGRTGTDSMKLALNELGFGPTYHMKELILSGFKTWGHPQRLGALGRGEVGAEAQCAELGAVLREYHSVVDFPGALLWRELAACWPRARVVLTLRPPDKWWASFNRTICHMEHHGQWWNLVNLAVPGSLLSSQARMMDALSPRFVGHGPHDSMQRACEDAEYGMQRYNEWNADVKRHFEGEPDRLLVFHTGTDGYRELARFLQVALPEGPYPAVNSSGDMEVLRLLVKAAAVVTLAAAAVFLLGGPVVMLGLCTLLHRLAGKKVRWVAPEEKDGEQKKRE